MSSRGGVARRGYGPLLAVMFASAIYTLGEGSLNVLLSPHLEQQGMSRGLIGASVAGFSVAALGTRFIAGTIYRRRLARFQIPFGCGCSMLSFLGLSAASDHLLLAGLIALNGVGFGFVSTGGLAAIMDLRPSAHAGSLMGWYTGSIGGGYAAAGFVGGLAGDVLGVAGAIRALTLVPLIAGIVMALGLRRFGTDEKPESSPEVGRPSRRPSLAGFRRVGPLVWLAFALALHINLLGGVLITYFPLYGLAIGLSLTQIGVLSGLHSSVSSLIRFATPLIFSRIEHRRLNGPLVALGSLAVAAITFAPTFGVLVVVWVAVGLSRGVVRVSSAALVMEASGQSDKQRGAASGIYLAGLDVGKIIGPLLGGVVAELADLTTAFLVAGLGFPIVYVVLSRMLLGRERRLGAESSEGTS